MSSESNGPTPTSSTPADSVSGAQARASGSRTGSTDGGSRINSADPHAGSSGSHASSTHPHAEAAGLRVRARALWRLLVVVGTFLPLAVGWWRDRRRYLLFGGRRDVTDETRRERAEYLLSSFVSLGPTFIKLGQLLSTRPDVLPRAYVTVLSRLQDRVPPDPWDDVEPLLDEEIGDVESVFESFDREPISGASLGQVYTARLDGERVAVKVLRPGIRRRVEADIRVLSVLVPVLARLAPQSQQFTLENLADEFAASIRREMDYELEAQTLERIAENFADDPKIRLPTVAHEHSTDRVLVMEYVDGVKITDLEALERRGIDRSALVERLENAYIRMIVEHGLFHADPHPGNLAVRDDGTIVFYDFGMAGRLDERTREQLFEFYVAVAEDDVDRMIDAFIALGALDPAADRQLMAQGFELVLDSFRGEDISQYQVAELFEQFQGTMQELPMRLPQNLALVVRVSSVLEGVCRTLDPDFDFISVVREYVADRATETATADRVREEVRSRAVEFERSVRRVPRQLEAALDRQEHDALRVSMDIESEDSVFGRLARQVVFGSATAAAVVATAGLYGVGNGSWAVVAAGAALLLGVLTKRAFRTSGPRRDVQAGAAMAQRSLRGRQRSKGERGREE
ncbi:ABC1 kinase family protein [Halapricum hydrolyticum]|uniref:AarF/ABC1/UbiB kinase family protein n=1 Tax=Halapricum hydrolyticum TaxID=2979991 RepID=A0AAE3IHH4_9EURY|nr:AarF/ABC1/UbiB kinase family protein [Halapricum hydrolyticum]MCU4719488.1 AarF/ABC1/UbiB kinase family protein [Halapricum hydrolyticum]MCU4728480.1 AarF/ABC1/UbiB kinase family protein [Halapricum hydrolyticum]